MAILMISLIRSDYSRKSQWVSSTGIKPYLINSNLEIKPQRRGQLPKCSSLPISDYSVVIDHVQPFNPDLIPLTACLKKETINNSYQSFFCSRFVTHEDRQYQGQSKHSFMFLSDIECIFYLHLATTHSTRVEIVNWCYRFLINNLISTKNDNSRSKSMLL